MLCVVIYYIEIFFFLLNSTKCGASGGSVDN